MDILEFLREKFFRLNYLWHIGFFPHGKLSFFLEKKRKNVRFGLLDIFSEFLGSEFFEVSNETGNVRRRNDKMNMIQHENEAEKFQVFFCSTIFKRSGENMPSVVAIEKIIPSLDGKCKEVNALI